MRLMPPAPLLTICAPLALWAVSVGGCASTGTDHVVLTVDAGYASAQTAFVAFQNGALAAIRNGSITGATKAKVIDLVNQGQTIETRLYVSRSAADLVLLAGINANLAALGVKGN